MSKMPIEFVKNYAELGKILYQLKNQDSSPNYADFNELISTKLNLSLSCAADYIKSFQVYSILHETNPGQEPQECLIALALSCYSKQSLPLIWNSILEVAHQSNSPISLDLVQQFIASYKAKQRHPWATLRNHNANDGDPMELTLEESLAQDSFSSSSIQELDYEDNELAQLDKAEFVWSEAQLLNEIPVCPKELTGKARVDWYKSILLDSNGKLLGKKEVLMGFLNATVTAKIANFNIPSLF